MKVGGEEFGKKIGRRKDRRRGKDKTLGKRLKGRLLPMIVALSPKTAAALCRK